MRSAPVPEREVRREVEAVLDSYRGLAVQALLAGLPREGPAYLYDLLPSYPQRSGKGLRAALCLATCKALGGSLHQALNTAVAIELFHNAFLVHDDVQDGSESRRGGPTLHTEHGVGIAVNVGNALNLAALSRLLENHEILGPSRAQAIVRETQQMLRHTLEGQALELAWIRDNACDLTADDYYRMCLKKTSWYTCIYPCRTGALIAGWNGDLDRLHRFGWYLGAAFQVQDDLLNLSGSFERYGKEIAGDLWEGKRTLMLIHLLQTLDPAEREKVRSFLAKPRAARTGDEVRWLLARMAASGSLEHARSAARQLAAAALAEGLAVLADVPDSEDKRFLLQMALYVVSREH